MELNAFSTAALYDIYQALRAFSVAENKNRLRTRCRGKFVRFIDMHLPKSGRRKRLRVWNWTSFAGQLYYTSSKRSVLFQLQKTKFG
jgi:hypothetical protein